MLIPKFAPGCFGSAVFYRKGAPECSACTLVKQCTLMVRTRERKAIANVMKFDVLFGSSRTDGIAIWWNDRWKRKTSVLLNVSQCDDQFSAWLADGVNVFHLQHGSNPADRTKDAQLFEAFKFMIEVKAFKISDIAEHLKDEFPEYTKSKCLSYAKLLINILVYKDVVKKEKRGIYCL